MRNIEPWFLCALVMSSSLISEGNAQEATSITPNNMTISKPDPNQMVKVGQEEKKDKSNSTGDQVAQPVSKDQTSSHKEESKSVEPLKGDQPLSVEPLKGDQPLPKQSGQPQVVPTSTFLGYREAGTITIKPLTVNFSALTIGMSKKNEKLSGSDIDAYRSSFGVMANRTDRAGIGYDLELGVMTTRSTEVFTILGISYERPFQGIVVAPSPTAPFPNNLVNYSYNFKPKTNYEISLGGRYYWNGERIWIPFLGAMATVTFQDSVRADVFNFLSPTTLAVAPIGPFTLQSRKVLWGGMVQGGADFIFNKYTSISLSIGIRYTPRTHITYTTIAATNLFGAPVSFPVSFRDNRSLWSFPVLLSFKLTL